MGSAAPRLISPADFLPITTCRLGGSRSDLFAITPCRTLRNLSAATSSVGWLSRRQPRLHRLGDAVRLVRPVMGQQGPDRARRLVGQRDGDHVGWPNTTRAQRRHRLPSDEARGALEPHLPPSGPHIERTYFELIVRCEGCATRNELAARNSSTCSMEFAQLRIVGQPRHGHLREYRESDPRFGVRAQHALPISL